MIYRADIDGLRALAVVPVILYHAGVSYFEGGYVGVDIFFVISGYLITTIIISDIEANRFSLSYFYERRARRILPALFLVTIVAIPFAWHLLPPDQALQFSMSLVGVATFSSNIWFWQETGYFELASELKPLIHTWSLAIEEQFYLFFPIFLVGVWRYGKLIVYCSLLFIALASFLLAASFIDEKPSASFFLLPTRAWELLLGGLLTALPVYTCRKNFLFLRNILAAVGILMIFTAIICFDANTPTPSYYTLIPTVGAALVILCGGPGVFITHVLGSGWLVGIGLISYSLYLWHQPILVFSKLIFGSIDDSSSILIVVAVVTIFAYISWRFVEKPFRNKDRFSEKSILILSFLGLVFIFSLGVVGNIFDGFKQVRLSDEQKVLFSTAVYSPKRADCHASKTKYISPHDACVYGGSSQKLAVFGDSHGVELAFALHQTFGERVSISHHTFSGCYPAYKRLSSGDNAECESWSEATVEYISQDSDIQTVVVAYRLPFALYGYGDAHSDYPRIVDYLGAEERSARWDSLLQILRALTEAGKTVVLLLTAPELPMDISFLIMNKGDNNSLSGVPVNYWNERMAFVYESIEQIPSTVQVIDPKNIFCDAEMCVGGEENLAFYFDDNHLSIAGAQILASKINNDVHVTKTLNGQQDTQ